MLLLCALWFYSDELALNQIISNPIKTLRGNCWFQIIDLSQFRNYSYKLVELVLNKLTIQVNFKIISLN